MKMSPSLPPSLPCGFISGYGSVLTVPKLLVIHIPTAHLEQGHSQDVNSEGYKGS